MVLLLELARGLASLWVFLFHIKELFENVSPFFYQLSTYGHLGVPMFFVISGYVITQSAESSLKSSKPPLAFLKNRFLRIYPAFWASVLIILFIPYLLEAFSSLKTGHYISPENVLVKMDFWEWSNLLLLTKVFFATSENLQLEFNTLNAVYWTLAIEFQFYVVVFLALYLKKFYRHTIALVSVFAVLISFIPLNINYGLFIHYWPSFSVGIALAYLHRHGMHFRLNSAVKAILLMAVVVLTSCVAAYASPGQLHTSPILFALAFGINLWFFSDLERVLQIMKKSGNRITYWLLEPWLIIGAMSYSLYLLHVKLYLIPMMFVRQLIDPTNGLFSLFTIIGTLIICYPFYYFVERRFLSKSYQKIHRELIAGGPSQSRV